MRNARYKIIAFTAVLALAVASRPVHAASTTQQSIDLLSSDDPAERDAAENNLADVGKDAMDALRHAADDFRPEVRMRALRTLRRIELFRLRDVPTQQLAIANAYLTAPDYENRKLQLNLLFECLPAPDEVLTRLVPIETDPELRTSMLYKLSTGYRDYISRVVSDDDDTAALLTLLNSAAMMWRQEPAADAAAALYLTHHLDEQIARWTAEQTNGDTAEQERASSILCQLYRIDGKYDQAMKYARLSREQNLIFLILQDQGDWTTAANEQDDRWHDPVLTAAFHACFTRLAGHQHQAVEQLVPLVASALPDTDATFSPSKLFLLNDLPDDGLNLLLPRHPAVAFSMRVARGEITKAIEIAERYPDDTDLPGEVENLRQMLGELAPPTTGPTTVTDDNGPDWQTWQSAVKALNQKKYENAATIFSLMWSQDESHVDRLYLKGYALKSAGQTERGESLMHKAELIPLGDPLVRWRFAAQLDAAGLTDVAEQQRTFALRTGGSFDEVGLSEIWNTRAENAIQHKQWRDAADALDRLCLINLSSAVKWNDPVRFLTVPALAHLCKARDARQHGDMSTAMRELHIYQQYLPASSDVVLEWTPALDQLGDHTRADALFNSVFEKLDAICKKYPKSRSYLNELAWMSACCDRKLDEALHAAQTAVDLDPTDYQTLDTLAEVHFRRGDRQVAIALETRAMSMSHDPYLPRQLKRFQNAAVPSTTQPGPMPE